MVKAEAVEKAELKAVAEAKTKARTEEVVKTVKKRQPQKLRHGKKLNYGVDGRGGVATNIEVKTVMEAEVLERAAVETEAVEKTEDVEEATIGAKIMGIGEVETEIAERSKLETGAGKSVLKSVTETKTGLSQETKNLNLREETKIELGNKKRWKQETKNTEKMCNYNRTGDLGQQPWKRARTTKSLN